MLDLLLGEGASHVGRSEAGHRDYVLQGKASFPQVKELAGTGTSRWGTYASSLPTFA